MKSAMNWAMTTITFRAQLCSFDELVKIAGQCGFSGIELWEEHWRNSEADLMRWREEHPVPDFCVLSGYLDFTGLADGSSVWRMELEQKMTACDLLGVPFDLLLDVQMLVLHHGKERTASELNDLMAMSGFAPINPILIQPTFSLLETTPVQ